MTWAALWAASLLGANTAIAQQPSAALGREISVERHLSDGQEFHVSIAGMLAHGKQLFSANWTEQEGGGRPLSKGTGRPLSDPSQPLTGLRAFNRISAPDANSCAGCHNAPFGISGGGGDFVTNVFVLGQRFDSVTFDPKDTVPTRGSRDEAGSSATLQTVANLRATTGMFGAGYIEMLARQITADLQRIRDGLKLGQSKELLSKGIRFGTLARRADGLWDTSRVEGLPRLSLLSKGPEDPPTLVIRPWHQAGNVVSIREFTNNAYNHHHGMQATERFGVDTDHDGDGFANELTRADITAVTLYQAALAVPGRVIRNDPKIEAAVLEGEQVFEEIGCASCHMPRLPLDKDGWVFSEPSPYNPPGNLRAGESKSVQLDLNSRDLPSPRLSPDKDGIVWVQVFTDLKLHDICESDEAEPLDMNFGQWSPKFNGGNKRFLTKRLWGAANEPPFFHHGLFTTMRQSILAHAGEAGDSRRGFQQLPAAQQDALIEFLKTLQVLPPGTKALIVDEQYQPKEWPPIQIVTRK